MDTLNGKLKALETELANAEDRIEVLSRSLSDMTTRWKAENSMRMRLYCDLHDVLELHRLVRTTELCAAADRARKTLEACR